MSDKFKVGEYWRSWSGAKFRIVAVDCPNPDYPVIAMHMGAGTAWHFTSEGRYHIGASHKVYDLVEPWKEKLEAWVGHRTRTDVWEVVMHTAGSPPKDNSMLKYRRAPWLDEK